MEYSTGPWRSGTAMCASRSGIPFCAYRVREALHTLGRASPPPLSPELLSLHSQILTLRHSVLAHSDLYIEASTASRSFLWWQTIPYHLIELRGVIASPQGSHHTHRANP